MTPSATKAPTSDTARLLAAYATPSDIHGWARIGRSWCVIAICWAAAATPQFNGILEAALYLPIVLAIGIAMSGLEGCTHEATHATLFSTRQLNLIAEFLFAWPIGDTVLRYRAEHYAHHRHLGEPSDPAVQLFQRTGVDRFPRGFKWVMFVRPLLGYHTAHFVGERVSFARREPARAVPVIGFWLALAVLAVAFGRSAWFAAYVLIPVLYVLPILLFWTKVLDHAGPARRFGTPTTRTHGGPLSHFLYPNDEAYHLVHHLHPGVPAHRLKEAHGALVESNLLDTAIRTTGIGETLRLLRDA